MRYIAVDCGASFIKSAYFRDDEEKPEDVRTYVANDVGDKDLLDEQDDRLPLQLRRTVTIIRQVLLNYSDCGETLQLGISNEMHGFVVTDEDGIPITDYISWQKEYSHELYNEDLSWGDYYADILLEQDIIHTGMPLKPGLPSTNLPYVLEQNKRLCSDIAVYFYTLGDFIIRWLSGQQIYTHPTNAAATGLYDLTLNNWNQDIIARLGLEEIHFPVISENESITFGWKDRTICVKPAIGDQQAALYGARLCEKYQLSINMGTGGQVGRLADTLSFSEKYQIRPYFNGMYLMTVPHIPSGRALNVYIRFIQHIAQAFADCPVTDEQIWQWIFEEMECEKTEQELMDIDLGFFANAISKKEKGSIAEIGENALRVGNLFQSIFHQMASNIHECEQRIENGYRIDEILFSGGVVRKNAILRERIQTYYPQAAVRIAVNETLIGIYRYLRSDV